MLQWRSKQLDFASIDALRSSLDAAPAIAGLTRALPAVDQQALDHLARGGDLAGLTATPEQVELLWDVCALPDYRRITPAQHADMIAAIYADIVRHGAVREDYVAEQVGRAPIERMATSIRCRRAFHRFAPGPMRRTGQDGLHIRHTGRKRRVKSRIGCPMPCMSG